MFKHIVLYKLKTEFKDKKEDLKNKFLSMKGVVPQIQNINVGIDVLALPRSYDVSLCIDFISEEDYHKYKKDLNHAAVAEFVKQVTESSVSVDYVE